MNDGRTRMLDASDRYDKVMARRMRVWTDQHKKMLTLFGLMAVFFTIAAPSCRDYNGGGPSLNYDPRLPVDEAWVPDPML